MSVRKHLIHVKSNQLMTGSTTEPKLPNASDISYGEIAINYLKDKERIFIKNSDDEIVPFYSGKVIDDNEAVTAQALSDLDSRINDIEETSVNLENMENVTYSVLKPKRDNGKLVPGKYYRITDYVTTTSQSNTRSAGNQFDVIVLALDESTLSENAHAMLHDGDTYFSTNNANLGSWGLKYCLDNDTNKFGWADATNGKGVIYYMKDEWGNECPYDFKNIQFIRKISGGLYNPTDGTDTYVYTFTWLDGGTVEDASVTQQYTEYSCGVYNNVMLAANSGKFDVIPFKLNENVFISSSSISTDFNGVYGNSFGVNCTKNTLITGTELNGASYNLFGNNCSSNSFGVDCSANTFGSNCSNNTFGDKCSNNTFGAGCSSNSFGDSCSNNSFGSNCSNNSFGAGCNSNTFGSDCTNNSLGINSQSNTFLGGCSNNTYAVFCKHNFLGNDCTYNNFGTNSYYNVLMQGSSHNEFGEHCWENVLCAYVNYITFVKYTENTTVESGNSHISLSVPSGTETNQDNILKNITIACGVNETETLKVIEHQTLNDAFKTTYQPANSQTISV